MKAASVLFEGEVEIQTANGTSDNINAQACLVASPVRSKRREISRRHSPTKTAATWLVMTS